MVQKIFLGFKWTLVILVVLMCITGTTSVQAQVPTANENISKALAIKVDTAAIRALINIASSCLKLNDYEHAEKALVLANAKIKGTAAPLIKAEYYWQYAELLYKRKEYFSFVNLADSVLFFSEKAASNLWKVKGLHQKSAAYIHLGKLDDAMNLIKEAVAISTADKDLYYEAKGYQVIGNIAMQGRQLKEAINQYKRAIHLFAESKHDVDAAMAACSMSRAYIVDKMTDTAFYWNDSAKTIAVAHPDNLELNFFVWQNEGDYHARLGNITKSTIAFEKAKAVAEKMPSKYSLGGLLQVMSYAEFNAGNTPKALQLALESKVFFEELGDYPMLKKTYQLLYTYYEATGNYKQAYESLDEYTNISDSIFSKSSLEQINSLNVKYETTKKEKQITEQELLLTQKNARLRTFISIIIGAAIIIGLLVLVVVQRKKHYQQTLITLKKEQDISLLKALVTGEEKERSRLARELHDGLGGILAATQMQVSNINTAPTDADAKSKQKATELIQQAASESRRLAHNLLPETLHRYGLHTALKEFCEAISQSKLLQLDFEWVGEDSKMDSSAELSVFRIVQELINNIIKHAGATEALVQLQRYQNTLTVTVEDNGKGFSPKENGKQGIGLTNIASRISYLNGSLDIQSDAQKGTSVYIEIQLDKHATTS